MNDLKTNERYSIVVTGEIDHGKSTLIGRVLHDTDSLPHGKREQLQAQCQKLGKAFEYAYVSDALKNEQRNEMTTTTSRLFFETSKRRYTFIDTPGHSELLKNMVTGAARADAAFLVISAPDGIGENTKRHIHMLSMLGLEHLVVIVNKMDSIHYQQMIFERTRQACQELCTRYRLSPVHYIPVSARDGELITNASAHMSWYTGPSLIEVIDALPQAPSQDDLPFRMPVQDIYMFIPGKVIVAGSIDSGTITVGDAVTFYPSGITAKVSTIEQYPRPDLRTASAGQPLGITLDGHYDIHPGELMTRSDELQPRTSTDITTTVFWLGHTPFRNDRNYILKIGTASTSCSIKEIRTALDPVTLEKTDRPREISGGMIGNCTLRVHAPIAYDPNEDHPTTGRFVLVDDHAICGGGVLHAQR